MANITPAEATMASANHFILTAPELEPIAP